MQSPVKVWRNQKNIARLLGSTGEVLTWTYIRVPPGGFSNIAPYPVALVRLDSGENITAQVVDAENITIGTKVCVVVRRTSEPSTEGIIPYGIKVKPL